MLSILAAILTVFSYPFIVSAIPTLPPIQLPPQPSLSLNNSAHGLSVTTYDYHIPNTDLDLVLRPVSSQWNRAAIPIVLTHARVWLDAQVAVHGGAAFEVSGQYNYNVTAGMLLRVHIGQDRANLLSYGVMADVVRGLNEWEEARWGGYLAVIFSLYRGPQGLPIGNGCLDSACPF